MKQFRTVILIAGILVAGIAFNSVAQQPEVRVSEARENAYLFNDAKHKEKGKHKGKHKASKAHAYKMKNNKAAKAKPYKMVARPEKIRSLKHKEHHYR